MREASKALELEPEGVPKKEEEGSPRAARFSTRVLLSASRMSEAEEPPLKRCSRGELRDEEAHAGGWKDGRGGGFTRVGSAQPREAVRDARSSFGGDGEVEEGVGWRGTGLYSEEADWDSAGGSGVEEVVGWGLIAVLWGVVDKDRCD